MKLSRVLEMYLNALAHFDSWRKRKEQHAKVKEQIDTKSVMNYAKLEKVQIPEAKI